MRKKRRKSYTPEETLRWAENALHSCEQRLSDAKRELRVIEDAKWKEDALEKKLRAVDGHVREYGFFGILYGEGAKKARERDKLEEQIRNQLWESRSRREELERTIRSAEEQISKFKRIADRQKGVLRRYEKRRVERALLARATNSSREAARSLKANSPYDHECPYCGYALGDNPHLDHIYPVRLGGLSHSKNLVHVCAACNLRKKDMTLNQFIEALSLDRRMVFERLRALGKDY